ncbi:septum formation family protein [Nocardioides sp. GY 10127]|uniref:septum formation family protein n=1 Tax=Nocardioides sp. GY 10127 TaxID=2569762 RepID=UPI0010A852DC|nr:septum formation family protein [Nocardioides sp. GY 10127]TIC83972.1 hypothetical protein E8D37_03925 [Nocardioides sp. GY 10127]
MSGRRRARRSLRARLLAPLVGVVALALVVGLGLLAYRLVGAARSGSDVAAEPSSAVPSGASSGATPSGTTPSGSGSATGSGSTSPSRTASAKASDTASADASVDRPAQGACYRLGYDAVVSPTSSAKAVPCRSRHTTQTFDVAELDSVVDGHLLAVDSSYVSAQGATTCPAALVDYLGGSEERWRLSMLRSVWFTPSLAESDAGATWLRCDVVLRSGTRLARLDTGLAGVLATSAGRQEYGMCGTARPSASDFSRVPCGETHTWKALSSVDVGTAGGAYPGRKAARAAGQSTCESAGQAAAGGSLDFEWGYEWPTREQWQAGQTWGYCWAPA